MLNTAKSNIKYAIEGKGQDLTDVSFTDYASKIEQIERPVLQEKTAYPSEMPQEIVPDINFNGLRKVLINPVETESIGVKSGEVERIEYPSEGKYIKSVTVLPIKLQSKTVTENGKIVPDEGFDGIKELDVQVEGSGGGFNGLQWKCDNMKSLYYEFYQANADISIPLAGLDTSPVENFDYFADSLEGTDSLELDVTNTKTMKYAFRNSSIKSLYLRNMGKNNIVMNYMLQGCASLETLVGVNLINSSTGTISLTFGGCTELKNLEVANIKQTFTIGSVGAYGDKLTLESLVNTIKELWDFSSSSSIKKLTMGATNLAKLTDVYVKLVDVTDEMLANDPYADQKKPCVVCESTDEGAMLITEYATSKNWQLA